jgi:hypothetical protein
VTDIVYVCGRVIIAGHTFANNRFQNRFRRTPNTKVEAAILKATLGNNHEKIAQTIIYKSHTEAKRMALIRASSLFG